jgi:hypothetical protein
MIIVQWNIPTKQLTGQDLYRLRHLGIKNNISGREQYIALSRNFTINN